MLIACRYAEFEVEDGKVTVTYSECTLDPYIIRGSVTGFAVATFF